MWIDKIMIINIKIFNEAIHKIVCIDEKKQKKMIVKKKNTYLHA